MEGIDRKMLETASHHYLFLFEEIKDKRKRPKVAKREALELYEYFEQAVKYGNSESVFFYGQLFERCWAKNRLRFDAWEELKDIRKRIRKQLRGEMNKESILSYEEQSNLEEVAGQPIVSTRAFPRLFCRSSTTAKNKSPNNNTLKHYVKNNYNGSGRTNRKPFPTEVKQSHRQGRAEKKRSNELESSEVVVELKNIDDSSESDDFTEKENSVDMIHETNGSDRDKRHEITDKRNNQRQRQRDYSKHGAIRSDASWLEGKTSKEEVEYKEDYRESAWLIKDVKTHIPEVQLDDYTKLRKSDWNVHHIDYHLNAMQSVILSCEIDYNKNKNSLLKRANKLYGDLLDFLVKFKDATIDNNLGTVKDILQTYDTNTKLDLNNEIVYGKLMRKYKRIMNMSGAELKFLAIRYQRNIFIYEEDTHKRIYNILDNIFPPQYYKETAPILLLKVRVEGGRGRYHYNTLLYRNRS